MVAERKGDLYYVKEVPEKAGMLNQEPNSQIMDWHVPLGHLNEASLKMSANTLKRVKYALKASIRKLLFQKVWQIGVFNLWKLCTWMYVVQCE